jgi:6-pyruvoyl-tetrahydropterin synthase
VDATFRRPELDEDGLVVDIGRAADRLHTILADFNYRNLDDDPTFTGKNTTTEFLAREIFERLAHALREGGLGPGGRGVTALRVTLHESHVAWASYEGSI